MATKYMILLPILLVLAACTPDVDMVTVTARPQQTATSPPTPTAVPLPLPTDTAVPPASLPLLIPTDPPAPRPTPTDTPLPPLPTASVLFVRDHALQKWDPQTGTVEILAEQVSYIIDYASDIVVFLREIQAEQDEALIVFHIPTQSEYELFRASTMPFRWSSCGRIHTICISPNGRWLAYVSGESDDSVTLSAHEILVGGAQVTVSPPVLTTVPGAGWNWPYDQLLWPTGNELSWSDQAGIWVADLTADPVEPVVAVAASTNTFPFVSPNPATWDEEPVNRLTIFIPKLWSPDGRYLLVNEYFFEYGEFRVIERDTNRVFALPDSGVGPVSDTAVWLDETTLVHFGAFSFARFWHLNPENDLFLTLEKTIPLEELWDHAHYFSLVDGRIRFNDYHGSSILELDSQTGELVQLSPGVPYRSFHWSPDGRHALLIDSVHSNDVYSGHVYLDFLNGRKPMEMDSIFGPDSCCFHWIEDSG